MKIATLSGIPVRLHWSFLVLGGGYLAVSLYTRGPSDFVELVALLAMLFGSVVLHELGHALAARAYGIRTAHITLYPFGGVAAISHLPTVPLQELVIALAGPAVNVLLALFGLALWVSTGVSATLALVAVNLAMALFNLVPAFPMDGGRVLRAALATQMGWVPASRLAMQIGRVFAWGFIGLALVLRHLPLALVGGFLLLAIAGESRRLVESIHARWRPVPRWVGDSVG